jgi:hypothetical protein
MTMLVASSEKARDFVPFAESAQGRRDDRRDVFFASCEAVHEFRGKCNYARLKKQAAATNASPTSKATSKAGGSDLRDRRYELQLAADGVFC